VDRRTFIGIKRTDGFNRGRDEKRREMATGRHENGVGRSVDQVLWTPEGTKTVLRDAKHRSNDYKIVDINSSRRKTRFRPRLRVVTKKYGFSATTTGR